MQKNCPIILFIFSALTSFTAYSDSELNHWSFSGFGTIGYTYDDSDGIGYIRDYSQELDIEQEHSFLTDSQIGGQFSYRSSAKWSAMVQLVLANEVDYEAIDSLEWAYVALHPTSNIDIRFGRMGLDLFSLSDTRRIDYAHLWVRPPSEVYGWVPLYSIDGIDAAYYFETEHTFWRIKAQYGQSRSKSAMNDGEVIYDFKGDNLFALSLTADRNDWIFRTTLATITIGEALPEEAQAVQSVIDKIAKDEVSLLPREIRQQAQHLSQELDIEGENVYYAQISATFDNHDWLLLSELTYSESDVSIMPNGLGGYLTLAKRMNEFMPYVSYAFFQPNKSAFSQSNEWKDSNPQLDALFQNAAMIINSGRIEQHTMSLGLRWDVYQQVALNLQWDHVSIESAGSAMWAGNGNELYQANTINLFSASVSFVF